MGYDINRFKNLEINQEFICGICHDVLQNPLVIDPCDHTFCSDCINSWIIEKDNCPVDREKISRQNLHKPFRLFMNLLNESEISCDYLTNGCKQYVQLGELVLHTEKCTFNPNLKTLCECGLSIATNELLQHQNDCVDYLQMQLSRTLDLVNTMNLKITKIESDLIEEREEITLISEWDKVDASDKIHAIKEIQTNMTEMMFNNSWKLIYDSLNERVFNIQDVKKRFCEEFGGNWFIYTGKKIDFSVFHSEYFFSFEIGKISVHISMRIKTTNNMLDVDKLIKILVIALEKNVWSDKLMITGSILHNLTDDSLILSERLLDKNIINYFIKYDQLFPYNDKSLWNPMLGLFANISEHTELRHRLMSKEFIAIILRLFSHTNPSNAYVCYYIFANILSESNQFWKQHFKHDRLLNRNLILAQMKTQISQLKINTTDFNLEFNTFKPFNRLLRCNVEIPQEVHYFAVWSLAFYTRKDCKNYCYLLREDGCIQVLQELIQSRKTEEYVKKLANLVLYQNQQFSKYGNLDELQNSDTVQPL